MTSLYWDVNFAKLSCKPYIIIPPLQRSWKGGILVSRRPSVCIYFTIWEKIKENPHHYNTILSFYNIKTLQEEFAKKSNIPWIWRIIYGHKLPYMKKTRKKKQVCGAACFMAAEIKFSKDVRLSVSPSVCGPNCVRSVFSTILSGSISYLHILSSNIKRCVSCKGDCRIPKFEFLAKFVYL